MNRKQRVEALKQVITHTINGDRELAESLFKQVSTASAREILVREANYSVDDDPEFDARREMQRELEDDLDSGRMEPGADEMGDEEACPECGAAPCECSVDGEDGGMIDDIVSKLENGEVDDEILAAILDLVSQGDEPSDLEGGEPNLDDTIDGEPGVDGEPGIDDVPGDEEIDLDSLMKNEGVNDGAQLMAKIKFALEYDYDQFLDSGGEASEWPEVALGNPSPELQELLLSVPDAQRGAYNSMIDKIVHFQAGNSARLKDLI